MKSGIATAVWCLWLLAALLVPGAVRPESTSAGAEEGSVLTRPGLPGAPTQVAVGLYLLDVARIDDADQTLRVDFVLWTSWRDPRLASAGGQRLTLNEVWHPRIQVVNERSLRKRRSDEVDVDPDGEAVQIQRYSGTVASATDLADFPFDEQRFEIRVFGGGQTQQEVEIVVETARTGRSDRFSIADWAVGPLIAETFEFKYAPDGRVFPGCAFAFDAKRSAAFYVWKVILPLVIVVLLSWTVFWIDPGAIGAQIGVAATSILALIAYQFVLVELVPRLSYLTRQDRFLTGSTVLVLAALFEVIVTSNLAGKGELELAKRIDWWSRSVFPVAFLLLIAVVFWF